jgi:hypothetical protein
MLKWIGHHPQVILQTLMYLVGIFGGGFLAHYFSSTKEDKITGFIAGAICGGFICYIIISIVFVYN